MLAFARETRLSETTFVQTATRDGRRLPQPDLRCRRGRAAVRRPSVARHRRRRGARRAASARAPTSRRRAPGCSRSTSSCDGDARRRLDAAGAGELRRELDPARGARRRRASSAADADPELPPQFVSTGRAAGASRRCATRRRSPRAAPDYVGIGRCSTSTRRSCLYLAASTRPPAARTRELRPHRDIGRGPGDRLGRRPADGLRCTPAPAPSACASTRASRWAVPSVLECAVEGDRVRVGGDVVVLVEGTVAAVGAGRTSSPSTRKVRVRAGRQAEFPRVRTAPGGPGNRGLPRRRRTPGSAPRSRGRFPASTDRAALDVPARPRRLEHALDARARRRRRAAARLVVLGARRATSR